MASAAKLAPAAPLPVLVHRPPAARAAGAPRPLRSAPAARLQRLAAAMVRTDTPAGRTLLFLTSALLGAALMLGAWQGYRYERLLHAVGALEQEQRHWHERNKQAMDAMVTLGSPRRIDAAARKLGLQRIDIGHRLMVQLAVPEPPARGEAGR